VRKPNESLFLASLAERCGGRIRLWSVRSGVMSGYGGSISGDNESHPMRIPPSKYIKK